MSQANYECMSFHMCIKLRVHRMRGFYMENELTNWTQDQVKAPMRQDRVKNSHEASQNALKNKKFEPRDIEKFEIMKFSSTALILIHSNASENLFPDQAHFSTRNRNPSKKETPSSLFVLVFG